MADNNPEKKTRLEQLTRPQEHKLPGRFYTGFVRFLRLALPLAALSIIALLFSWPQMEETLIEAQDESLIPAATSRNELLSPRFESADEKNQPFTITAKRALQSDTDPDIILLDKPMADITLNSGAWVAAEAMNGQYRQEAEKLMLEGDVVLFHDKGYEMKTEQLMVDLKGRQASSEADIYGQGPAGTIKATGLQAYSEGGKLIFKGPVRLVLNREIEGIP